MSLNAIRFRDHVARPDAKPRLRPLGKLLQRPGRDRGDIQLQTVTGSVRAQTIGSGELRVDQASGSLQVQQLGSGEVKHNNIGGDVQLPRKP